MYQSHDCCCQNHVEEPRCQLQSRYQKIKGEFNNLLNVLVIDILTEGSLFLCGIHPSPCKENAGQGSFGVWKTSFMGKKIEFQGKKSSFKLFGKIEFPSKRTKKAWDLKPGDSAGRDY